METLELLGMALGLASLAGLNLYLTVFVTGLAVRFDWIQLAEQYSQLSVLAHPVVIGISGAFFLFEFFADKVPWVDSVWDSVHTFIRPVGGAMLAILVLGDPNPVFDVVVGILAGGVALTTHSAKATSRLLANASPEPFSNIGLSLAEDTLVLGGLGLLAWNPAVALAVLVLVLAGIFFAAPRLFRIIRSRIGFAWKKLTAPSGAKDTEILPKKVPVDLDCQLHQMHPGEVHVQMCIPVSTGRLRGVPGNVPGQLVALEGEEPTLYWSGKVWWSRKLITLTLDGRKISYDRGFLYDKLTIYRPDGSERTVFFVDRSTRPVAESAVELLGNSPKAPPAEIAEAPSAEPAQVSPEAF